MISTLSPGERYDVSFSAATHGAVVVGLNVYPDAFFAASAADRELEVDPRCVRDATLLEACRALLDSDQRADIGPSVRGAVRDFLGYAAREAAPDAVLRVKTEIDRTYDRELYMEHLCDIAGLHMRALQRGFRRRFGVSPVTYRTRTRLNAMARALWSDPTRSIEQIAADVGFNSVSYAHRAYRAYFGTTPALHSQRTPWVR